VVLRIVPSDYVLAAILSVLHCLVIRKISAAIALLNGVTLVLSVYLYVCLFRKVVNCLHSLHTQPGTKRVKCT